MEFFIIINRNGNRGVCFLGFSKDRKFSGSWLLPLFNLTLFQLTLLMMILFVSGFRRGGGPVFRRGRPPVFRNPLSGGL
jgi:hypothetical protein